MSCRTTCACQCQNSACGCLSPGKQPHGREKKWDPVPVKAGQEADIAPVSIPKGDR